MGFNRNWYRGLLTYSKALGWWLENYGKATIVSAPQLMHESAIGFMPKGDSQGRGI